MDKKQKSITLKNGSVIKFTSSGGNSTMTGVRTACYWRDETFDEYMEEELKELEKLNK